ncbi:AAA family ATPase [Streptomyces sp. NPDC050658]|uniref:ATP-binding protein n=1 Tax=unclassified Streptomyces TaxID=2593676 RepID=UPI00342F397B
MTAQTAAQGPQGHASTVDTDILHSVEPGTLLVAVGPGGSGKSTFATAAAGLGMTILCLDALRHEISGDAGDQSATTAAVERQNALLESHLSTGTTVFLDSTNVEPAVRAALVERARRHGRPVVALRFPAPLDTCRARNHARTQASRRVPDAVLVWQHEQMRAALPHVLLAEGFTAAYDVAHTL